MENITLLELSYQSLLADVASLSGFSEIRGTMVELQWVLKEAPKLEKLMLATIETGQPLDLERWPEWLHNLARCSVWNAYCLRLLRQLLLFGYKASVPHDNETVESAFSNFEKTNLQVGQDANAYASRSPLLLDLARRHCQSALLRFQASASSLTPKHGPGAVTTDKDRWTTVFDSIEYLYPYSDLFCLAGNRDMYERWEETFWPSQIEAKVIAVPKDSRGPRLICVHPAEAIWIQQGLRLELEKSITQVRKAKGPWPHGHVHFDNQRVNGQIALLSSDSRRYATIDMKEASDRISDVLVQILFGRKYKHFGCCRAQKYRIPSNSDASLDRVGDIHSYAPMGNATTFPVQSVVFWSICVAAMQYHGFRQPGAVFVFGDDIIVPTVAAECVTNALEQFGLLVNKEKSFWRGAFRESCGVDAFKGVNVTPVRWKTTVNAEDILSYQSVSDMAMRFRIAGYDRTAKLLYGWLNKACRYTWGRKLPLTSNIDHGGIAEYVEERADIWNRGATVKWHNDHQKLVTPVIRIEDVDLYRSTHDWNHVLESLTRLQRVPIECRGRDVPVLERSADPSSRRVPSRVRPVFGWTDLV